MGKWRIYGRQQFDEGKAKPPPRRKLKLIVRSSSSANGIGLDRNNNNKNKSSYVTKIHYTNNSHNNNLNDVRKDSRVRLILFTKDKVAVQFNGPIIAFSFENPYIKHIVRLGPDPLRSRFDTSTLCVLPVLNTFNTTVSPTDLLLSI